jgi:hypothetical protein
MLWDFMENTLRISASHARCKHLCASSIFELKFASLRRHHQNKNPTEVGLLFW